MIQPVKLTSDEQSRIEEKLYDYLTAAGVFAGGLEVKGAQYEGDCYKIFYCYEDEKNKYRTGSIYVAELYGQIKECLFDKSGNIVGYTIQKD